MKHNPFIALFAIAAAIIIDQASKWEALASMWHDQPILGHWLTFRTVSNPGIAFSMPVQGLLLQVITVALCALMIYLLVSAYRQNETVFLRWGYACLVA